MYTRGKPFKNVACVVKSLKFVHFIENFLEHAFVDICTYLCRNSCQSALGLQSLHTHDSFMHWELLSVCLHHCSDGVDDIENVIIIWMASS